MILPFDEVVTLVKTEEVTVTIVARNTDVKTVTMQEVVSEEAETTRTAPEDMIVEVLVTEVGTETAA